MAEENVVTVKFSDELKGALEAMVSDDDTDQSKFIRGLVRREYALRIKRISRLPGPAGADRPTLVEVED